MTWADGTVEVRASSNQFGIVLYSQELEEQEDVEAEHNAKTLRRQNKSVKSGAREGPPLFPPSLGNWNSN